MDKEMPERRNQQRISVALIGVATLLTFAGCQKMATIEGQVFIVTKGRENVKLGMTDVYVMDAEEWTAFNAAVLTEFRTRMLPDVAGNRGAWEAMEQHPKLEELKSDLEAVRLIRAQVAAKGEGLIAVQRCDEIAEMIDTKLTEVKPHVHDEFATSIGWEIVENASKVHATIICKTDAEGRFRFQIPSGRTYHAVCFDSRKVPDGHEDYMWAVEVPMNGQPLLLSNDNQGSAHSAVGTFVTYVRDGAPCFSRELTELRELAKATEWDDLVANARTEYTLEISKSIADAGEDLADARKQAEEIAEEVLAQERTATLEKERLAKEAREQFAKKEAEQARLAQTKRDKGAKRALALKTVVARVETGHGQVLTDATIVRFLPKGVVFSTSAGMRTVDFGDLPPSWSNDFYDEELAVAADTERETERSVIREIAAKRQTITGIVAEYLLERTGDLPGAIIDSDIGRIFVYQYGVTPVGQSCQLAVFPTSKALKRHGETIPVWVMSPELATAFR